MFWGADIAMGASFGGNFSEVACISHADSLAEKETANERMMADAEIRAPFKKRENMTAPGASRDHIWRRVRLRLRLDRSRRAVVGLLRRPRRAAAVGGHCVDRAIGGDLVRADLAAGQIVARAFSARRHGRGPLRWKGPTSAPPL